ncbi:MAG: hypothetical protein K6T86_03015 [Pirellulales bacterium]|nr:hypothetical protein [Pirellulales bacterium]
MAGSHRRPLGGIIHTYQKFDPQHFPSPTQQPPDLLSAAFDHLLFYGGLRELSEEELARAVRLDPSQIAGLGPSLEALRELLLERKRKILATYETEHVQYEARQRYQQAGARMQPPRSIRKPFQQAFAEEQLHELEQLWYRVGGERHPFGAELLRLMNRLGEKYQIDELAAKYPFTGRTRLSIPRALEVKEELEAIDRLLKQLEEAARTAQIGVIDMEELSRFVETAQIEELNRLHEQIQEYLRQIAEGQGLERTRQGYQLSPRAYRLFQRRLLEQIFSELAPSRTGRHANCVVGEGAVEMQSTRPYEFGDSVTELDLASSFTNALLRAGPGLPVRLQPEDLVVHRTRNSPKCATVVVMDMSGSMRYDAAYVNVKRMALALDGLIRREFPGDYLQFVEMYTFAKLRAPGEIASLLPKPPTLYDPLVRLRIDMSRLETSELRVPQHFTNIQQGLTLARRLLVAQDTPNRQVILITDGSPTAHFEGPHLYLLYPPDRRTEAATLREAQLCQREGITINIFLLPSWSQSREDVQFAYRLAQMARGRVFFTAGRDLDRYVLWDYLKRRRAIIA